MRFENQVAMITGAASGMGLLSAQKLVEEGAKVILADVNAEAVSIAAEGLRKNGGVALGVMVDVRNYERLNSAAVLRPLK